MSNSFKLDIVNPEKSFFSKENVSEVVVPAFEGEMGILKDHISIISFLKPGIVKVIIGSDQEDFYVEDGIVEFKDNSLSILTSSVFNLNNVDKKYVRESIEQAEKELTSDKMNDQKKFLLNSKVEILKSLTIN